MENKNQTALGWFTEKVHELGFELVIDNIDSKGYAKKYEEYKEMALKMEKEQIIKAHRNGVDMLINYDKSMSGEEYYNETYKNDTSTSE